ncbi:hypothetical protein SAMN06295900_10937 [Trinickia caryophylli]|uniref:Uncharacterized protein n=1 Tax=Trinickia caryophylli TaxID=28094 RepID=A0A1X7FIA4_TRICW|nr:hypothetical protein SAMN06295900_10937 [Trinickia caryophylli]
MCRLPRPFGSVRNKRVHRLLPELLTVLRHEKHPKSRIVSNFWGAIQAGTFFVHGAGRAGAAAGWARQREAVASSERRRE